MDEQIVEYDDILHLFASLGFSGKKPPKTEFQKAISGEHGRGVQNLLAATSDYYFEQLKDWCTSTIARDGVWTVRSRFYKLLELGVLDFQQEDRQDGDAMILMVWDGEEYQDSRVIGEIIDDPFIIDGG